MEDYEPIVGEPKDCAEPFVILGTKSFAHTFAEQIPDRASMGTGQVLVGKACQRLQALLEDGWCFFGTCGSAPVCQFDVLFELLKLCTCLFVAVFVLGNHRVDQAMDQSCGMFMQPNAF